MNIQYYTEVVYGLPTMYIVDEELARKVKRLTGHKTVTEHDKSAMEDLGFTFQQVINPKFA